MLRPSRAARSRFITLLLVACATLAVAPCAQAQVSLDPLPVPAFGGTVRASVRLGDTLFVAGSFLGASPPADARGGLSIHNDTTGGRAAETAYVTGDVLATLPDGVGGYYIGGNFLIVDSVYRPWLARIRADGSLDPTFFPIVTGLLDLGGVQALARSGNTLFIGGDFDAVHGQPRSNLAAVDATTGALLPFSPVLGARVDALAVEAGNLYVGGLFSAADGQARSGLAAFNATTGALLPWAPGHPERQRARLRHRRQRDVRRRRRRRAKGRHHQRCGPRRRDAGHLPVRCLRNRGCERPRLRSAGRLPSSMATALACISWHSIPRAGACTPGRRTPPSPVDSMDVVGTTLYVGGAFTRISGEVRAGAAAFDWSTGGGALLPWNPSIEWRGQNDRGGGWPCRAGGRVHRPERDCSPRRRASGSHHASIDGIGNHPTCSGASTPWPWPPIAS